MAEGIELLTLPKLLPCHRLCSQVAAAGGCRATGHSLSTTRTGMQPPERKLQDCSLQIQMCLGVAAYHAEVIGTPAGSCSGSAPSSAALPPKWRHDCPVATRSPCSAPPPALRNLQQQHILHESIWIRSNCTIMAAYAGHLPSFHILQHWPQVTPWASPQSAADQLASKHGGRQTDQLRLQAWHRRHHRQRQLWSGLRRPVTDKLSISILPQQCLHTWQGRRGCSMSLPGQHFGYTLPAGFPAWGTGRKVAPAQRRAIQRPLHPLQRQRPRRQRADLQAHLHSRRDSMFQSEKARTSKRTMIVPLRPPQQSLQPTRMNSKIVEFQVLIKLHKRKGNVTQERSPPRRRSDCSRASTVGFAALPSVSPSLADAAADPDKLLSAGRSSQTTRSSERFSSICRCKVAECGDGCVSAFPTGLSCTTFEQHHDDRKSTPAEGWTPPHPRLPLRQRRRCQSCWHRRRPARPPPPAMCCRIVERTSSGAANKYSMDQPKQVGRRLWTDMCSGANASDTYLPSTPGGADAASSFFQTTSGCARASALPAHRASSKCTRTVVTSTSGSCSSAMIGAPYM
jgi:hypothetical protein